MDKFAEIMKGVNKKMTQGFEDKLSSFPKNLLTKKLYILLLTSTFIGISEGCFKDNSLAQNLCKHCINGTSLCEPETTFFVKLIDSWDHGIMDLTLLNHIKDIYNNTEELAECQLGQPIWDCLSVSEKYINKCE